MEQDQQTLLKLENAMKGETRAFKHPLLSALSEKTRDMGLTAATREPKDMTQRVEEWKEKRTMSKFAEVVDERRPGYLEVLAMTAKLCEEEDKEAFEKYLETKAEKREDPAEEQSPSEEAARRKRWAKESEERAQKVKAKKQKKKE